MNRCTTSSELPLETKNAGPGRGRILNTRESKTWTPFKKHTNLAESISQTCPIGSVSERLGSIDLGCYSCFARKILSISETDGQIHVSPILDRMSPIQERAPGLNLAMSHNQGHLAFRV